MRRVNLRYVYAKGRRSFFLSCTCTALFVAVLVLSQGCSSQSSFTGASSTSSKSNSQSSSSTSSSSSDSSYSGLYGAPINTVTGGGAAIATSSGVFVSSFYETDEQEVGIYYAADIDSSEQSYTAISAENGLYLNFYDGKLYYISTSDGNLSSIDDGQEIHVIEDPTNIQGSDTQEATQTSIYQAPDTSYISSMQIYDGYAYFIQSYEDSFELVSLSLDTNQAQTLFESSKESGSTAWCFVNSDGLNVLFSTQDNTWAMYTSALDLEDPSFTQTLSGEGQIACFTMINNELFYCTEESGSILRSISASGQQREYSSAQNAKLIVNYGSYIFSISSNGTVYLTHASSGISSSLQIEELQVKSSDSFMFDKDRLWISSMSRSVGGFVTVGEISSYFGD